MAAETDLLVTYVAGPFPTGAENDALSSWLEEGGRWLALHGTSGGKAARTERNGCAARQMVKGDHHQTLGCFFLNHPPISAFDVAVVGDHPVTDGLPKQLTVRDELYMIELQDPEASRILLTTELTSDPSPPGFGFVYDDHTSLQSDGKARVHGYARDVGKGRSCISASVTATPAVTAVRRLSIPVSIRTAPCRRNSTMSGRWGPSAPPAQRDQVGCELGVGATG